MACGKEYLDVVSAGTVLAGSSVIAIAGAPTIVLSAAGGAVAIGALGTMIAALLRLKECYERHGEKEKARKLGAKLEKLQNQRDDLERRAELAPA
jgi:hypothetical protein